MLSGGKGAFVIGSLFLNAAGHIFPFHDLPIASSINNGVSEDYTCCNCKLALVFCLSEVALLWVQLLQIRHRRSQTSLELGHGAKVSQLLLVPLEPFRLSLILVRLASRAYLLQARVVSHRKLRSNFNIVVKRSFVTKMTKQMRHAERNIEGPLLFFGP